MREIKFKAWLPNIKKMTYEHTLEELTKGNLWNTDGETNCSIIWLQYTGLKDKNGKEIYEGDICNCREYECFGKVEWNNEEAGFYFCVVVEGGGFEEEHLYDYIDELEVIGNVYENSELMKVEP